MATTSWKLGGGLIGQWTDPANWTSGVPQAGDTAAIAIAGAFPSLVDQHISNEQINVDPTGKTGVDLAFSGNDTLDKQTVLKIDTSVTPLANPVDVHFGLFSSGPNAAFTNSGIIDVSGNGSDGNGSQTDRVPFLLNPESEERFTNVGTMQVTNAALDMFWSGVARDNGPRPFVTNTGQITVRSTSFGLASRFTTDTNRFDPARALTLRNNGNIAIQGVFGDAAKTAGEFNNVIGFGTISIEDGTAAFKGDVSGGLKFGFINDTAQKTGDNVLKLEEFRHNFDATIQGFGAGDVIQLGAPVTIQSYDSATGVLRFRLNGSGVEKTLHFAGSYKLSNFKLVNSHAIQFASHGTPPLGSSLPSLMTQSASDLLPNAGLLGSNAAAPGGGSAASAHLDPSRSAASVMASLHDAGGNSNALGPFGFPTPHAG